MRVRSGPLVVTSMAMVGMRLLWDSARVAMGTWRFWMMPPRVMPIWGGLGFTGQLTTRPTVRHGLQSSDPDVMVRISNDADGDVIADTMLRYGVSITE